MTASMLFLGAAICFTAAFLLERRIANRYRDLAYAAADGWSEALEYAELLLASTASEGTLHDVAEQADRDEDAEPDEHDQVDHSPKSTSRVLTPELFESFWNGHGWDIPPNVNWIFPAPVPPSIPADTNGSEGSTRARRPSS